MAYDNYIMWEREMMSRGWEFGQDSKGRFFRDRLGFKHRYREKRGTVQQERDGEYSNMNGQPPSWTRYAAPVTDPMAALGSYGQVTATGLPMDDLRKIMDKARYNPPPSFSQPLVASNGGYLAGYKLNSSKEGRTLPLYPPRELPTTISNISPSQLQGNGKTINPLPYPVQPKNCKDTIDRLYRDFLYNFQNDRDSFEMLKQLLRNKLILRPGLNNLSNLNVILDREVSFQGGLVTVVNGNYTTVTVGDLAWAASKQERFISMLTALAHEFIHGMQNEKLGITDHVEKEVMAYSFNLFPNELLQYLKRNYPNSIPDDFFYCYPTYSTLVELQSLLYRFFNYYNKLSKEKRQKYQLFYDKAVIINNEYKSNFTGKIPEP